MGKRLLDNVTYSCPECGSEEVQVCMPCWVYANDPDSSERHYVDYDSDVQDESDWICPECEHSNFLPIETLKEANANQTH